MKNTLEGSKLFPYIAWILVFTFAATVFVMVRNANNEMNNLHTKKSTLEANLERDLETESLEGF